MAAWKAHTFTADTPFESALAKSLTGLGGQQLSGNVQCLDTFGGCINTLYNLKLVQGTGFLYDCYLFTPSQNQDTTAYRKRLLERLQKQACPTYRPDQSILLRRGPLRQN